MCDGPSQPVRWDHLRVCGADLLSRDPTQARRGSPPRVRSRRGGTVRIPTTDGITSACAEQTSLMASTLMLYKDHLRVCGADR